MKIYLVMTWTMDRHNDEFYVNTIRAFDAYDKTENYINEFVPDIKSSFFGNDELVEKNDEIETGGDFALRNTFAYRTGAYKLLRHFEEKEEYWYDEDPSCVELLIREMELE